MLGPSCFWAAWFVPTWPTGGTNHGALRLLSALQEGRLQLQLQLRTSGSIKGWHKQELPSDVCSVYSHIRM